MTKLRQILMSVIVSPKILVYIWLLNSPCEFEEVNWFEVLCQAWGYLSCRTSNLRDDPMSPECLILSAPLTSERKIRHISSHTNLCQSPSPVAPQNSVWKLFFARYFWKKLTWRSQAWALKHAWGWETRLSDISSPTSHYDKEEFRSGVMVWCTVEQWMPIRKKISQIGISFKPLKIHFLLLKSIHQLLHHHKLIKLIIFIIIFIIFIIIFIIL